MAIGSQSREKKKGKQITQIELTDASLPLKDVLARVKSELLKSHARCNESEWLRVVQSIDKGTPTRTELLVFADFSATCDLHAAKLDNCSQDARTVLATCVTCHSPCLLVAAQQEEDGEDAHHHVNDCDV